ncbi:hypothetical protein PSA01_01900 [Pseudonocardia saturnea]|uniref:Transcriptional regulator n=1 Tax=Pseudonocardia saturnea TaxID=33909 RepID=A0ABQ0RR79_9PSEU|nr:hypothetical protein PSA01_01900 [Pseudonocardia saturnea]
MSPVTRSGGGFADGGYIRNTGVVKTNRTAQMRQDPACGHGSDAVLPASGTSTRAAVARVLMEQGPVTAAIVAGELGLTEAAVRRHLDALIADGEAEVRAPVRSARPRGRGRPAREYLLTDTGRVRFGHGYDDLATSALRFLAETAGEQAVDAFARRRVRDLLGADMESVTAFAAPQDRAEALARVLSARGYAAQTRRGGLGVQLCQHHCPVAHVATEFPELCEAETRAFADILGTHVQRLATIARGDAACTTHVPLEDPELLVRTKHHEKRRPGAGGPQPPPQRTRQVHEEDHRSGTVGEQPASRVRQVQEDDHRPGSVGEQPASRVRQVQEEDHRSGTVSRRPTSQVRQVQEEDGLAGGESISHHGPRKGGSPYDDHS